MTATRLACPHCGSTSFHSWEDAQLGYAVEMTADDGPVYSEVESYEVADEGTAFGDNLSCRGCNRLGLKVAELVEVAP